jgi:hypothetical protein
VGGKGETFFLLCVEREMDVGGGARGGGGKVRHFFFSVPEERDRENGVYSHSSTVFLFYPLIWPCTYASIRSGDLSHDSWEG